MAVLTADANLVTQEPRLLPFAVGDNQKIYKDSLVCVDTNGYAVVGADTASFVCAGLAYEQVDNTLVGHTAGGKTIRVYSDRVVTLPATGMAQTSVGLLAYVKDSGAVALAGGVTNSVIAGLIVKYNSATSVDVWIPPTVGIGALSGLTATATELNKLHSVVAGTTLASSALVVDAAKSLDTLGIRGNLLLTLAASVAYAATMALVVATPVITVAASFTTSATATINCAAAAPAGATLTIITTTDGSGTCTVTFGTNFKTTGTQATTLSKKSTISFVGDGTNWNEVGRATAM